MDKLHVIYRISDKGNPKEKLANGGKMDCLKNAVREFGQSSIYVIADNCEDKTVGKINAMGLNGEIASRGNSGTCRYIIGELINNYAADDYVYLLEDDYLHLPGSREALLEGLAIADYVTLYDHPDFYRPFGRGSDNPLVHDDLVPCRLYLTKHRHWRSVMSTTMTFACKVGTLREDWPIFDMCLKRSLPMDFFMFLLLTKYHSYEDIKYVYGFPNEEIKQILLEIMLSNAVSPRPARLLISAVPGMATHTEPAYLSPLVDWGKVV